MVSAGRGKTLSPCGSLGSSASLPGWVFMSCPLPTSCPCLLHPVALSITERSTGALLEVGSSFYLNPDGQVDPRALSWPLLDPLPWTNVFRGSHFNRQLKLNISKCFLICVFCVSCCVFCSGDLPLCLHQGQPAAFSICSVTNPVRSQEALLSLALYPPNQRQPLLEFQAAVWGCVAAGLRDRAGALENGEGASPRSLLVSKKPHQRLEINLSSPSSQTAGQQLFPA